MFKKRKRNEILAVILLIFIFVVLYSLLSIIRHQRFDSFAYDLGIYDQVVWKYSRFKTPYSTIKEKIIFGDHFTPTLVFLAPLYWFWDNVRALLAFQAFWMGFSAFGLYLLAKHKKLSLLPILAVLFSYLSFFGIQNAINFDFHAIMIGIGFLPWIFLFWEKEDWRKFTFLTILFLGSKENLALIIFSLGILTLFKKKVKIGVLITVLSLLYFFLVIGKIIPYFSPAGYEYGPSLPDNIFGFVKNFFLPIEKTQTLVYSFLWFSFLPFLSFKALFLSLIDFSQYFLSGDKYSSMWGFYMHYRASIAPILAWGMIDGFSSLKKKKININKLAVLAIIIPLFLDYRLHLPLNKLSKGYYWQREKYMDDNQAMINYINEAIPKDAGIVTQNNLVAHLTHRDDIFLLWAREEEMCGELKCWWLFWPDKPDYLLVDLHQGQALTHLLVDSEKELKKAVFNMIELNTLSLEKKIGETYLFKINK
ncbi:DUF2079 domain-containing protein [Candidatus Microgenomates bacterium]|nr:DUF2079 domain-containing protein [Candidatus Microgenomates bacterium]